MWDDPSGKIRSLLERVLFRNISTILSRLEIEYYKNKTNITGDEKIIDFINSKLKIRANQINH